MIHFHCRAIGLTIGSLLIFATVAVAQRTVAPLAEGWRFKQAAAVGADSTSFDDSTWENVTVPHAFPPVGGPDHPDVYRGEAWYRLKFQSPDVSGGRRTFLRFDAVAMTSDAYLNGRPLGRHSGGFSAFVYDITDTLKPGPNQLAVRVDDRWNNDVSPLETSLLYGGIYRGVSLVTTDAVQITPLDYGSPGVFLTPRDVSSSAATVDVRTEVGNTTVSPRPVDVRITLTDAEGHESTVATAKIDAVPGKTTDARSTFRVERPHLWNGVADPYLYAVRVDVLDNGRVIDSVTQPLGLRSFHVDAQKGFCLNGVYRQIHGACLHQDWGTLGWAVPPERERQDLDLLRAMGVDGLRLVHYPHSQSALDSYDRSGMIVWAELAQFRLVGTSPAYRENVRQQLKEMIRQNYNHPSIVMWSLANELASKVNATSGPIMKELNDLAHGEDPTRPTTTAASGDTIYNSRPIVAGLDLVAYNCYDGWYTGAPDDMNRSIDKINALYGNRGLSISEYGGGAKVTDHRQNLKAGDVAPRKAFQPEEWQASVHEGNYAAIRSRPFVWGSFLWLAFDSGGIPKADGTIEGGNIKGLVTQDRRTCKDAYYFYQANWATKPMLYLTSRRDNARSEAVTPVKAYSNADAVTLTVNGRDYGTQRPDGQHTFRWPDVRLSPGENRVELTAADGLKDTATWTLNPKQSP